MISSVTESRAWNRIDNDSIYINPLKSHIDLLESQTVILSTRYLQLSKWSIHVNSRSLRGYLHRENIDEITDSIVPLITWIKSVDLHRRHWKRRIKHFLLFSSLLPRNNSVFSPQKGKRNANAFWLIPSTKTN